MQVPATILLVEDNYEDLFLIRRAMEKARLINPIQVVRDGEEAINYLAGEGLYSDRAVFPIPFLVLLDLHLPKIDGFEVLQWIRSHPGLNDLTVVVLTSSSDEREYARAIQLGASSYFRKPGCLDEFVELMFRIHGNWLLVKCTGPLSEEMRAVQPT